MATGGPGLKAVLSALAILVGMSLPRPAPAAAPDPSGLAFQQRQGNQVPLGATFTDQSGASTTFGATIGSRPTVLQLGYFSCPALCGLSRDDTLAALAGSGLRLGDDYRFTFVAIDSAETPRDAAAALAVDLSNHPVPGDPAAFHYLTGSATALAAAVGFPSRYDTMLKQFLHPSGIIVLTPDGVVSSYLMGIGYASQDLRAAIVQAGQRMVAPPEANPILLMCFHYDSTTGRYTLSIMKVLRLFAGLTVVAAVSTVVYLRRAERRA